MGTYYGHLRKVRQLFLFFFFGGRHPFQEDCELCIHQGVEEKNCMLSAEFNDEVSVSLAGLSPGGYRQALLLAETVGWISVSSV